MRTYVRLVSGFGPTFSQKVVFGYTFSQKVVFGYTFSQKVCFGPTFYQKVVYMNHPKTSPYALDDTSNYNYILQNTVVECFTNYVEIINAYIAHSKNIHTLNNTLYTYLQEKGMSTINHIFKLMLLYTKNLDLTNYYCRQTISYYVEFIEQNMQHEDNEKINYNNASRFSYSKTIDKLIKHYRKTSYNELDDNTSELLYNIEEKETEMYSVINMLMDVYNKIMVLNANAVGASASAAGSSASVAGSSASVAGASTSVAGSNIAFTQHLLNLVANESYPREKLMVLSAFINNFHMKHEAAFNYIFCLCEHLKYDLPSKNTIIKKLLSAYNKIRLQTDSVDAYICWIMAGSL